MPIKTAKINTDIRMLSPTVKDKKINYIQLIIKQREERITHVKENWVFKKEKHNLMLYGLYKIVLWMGFIILIWEVSVLIIMGLKI